MAPNPRVISAFRAMKSIGISEDKVKPVLKNLLKLYEKNWELIEEENYRALADAIFEQQDEAEAAAQLKKPNNAEAAAQLKKPSDVEREEALDEATQEEPERPLKRLRLKYQDGQPPHSCNNASTALTGSKLKKPKVEVDEVPNDHQSQQQSNGGRTAQSQPATYARNKGKQPISPNSHPVQPRDRGKEHLAIHSASQKTSGTLALIKPKDEPFTDDMPHYEAPLACLPPEPTNESGAPNGNCSRRDLDAPETLASKSSVGKDARNYTAAASTEMVSNQQLARFEDGSSSNLEIASSPSGEVKISINCSSTVGGPDFHLPNLNEVLKLVEDRCLRSYKFLDPNFSVMKLMKDMCECIEILGTKTYSDRTETENMMTAITRLETSLMEDDFDSSGRLPDSTNELINFEVDAALVQLQTPHLPLPCNGVHDSTIPEEVASENSDRVAAQDDLEQINFQSLVPMESCQPSSDKVWSLHDVIDITNGQEKMVISIVNEVNSEVPPSFHYIAQSVVFQNAYVNFSLACIGDNHSCSTCSGDCLSLSVPCVCAQQNRGDFAYTLDGLLKEDLLKDCISINQDPKKHSQFFCKVCPLERSKNDDIVEPCKGHVARTFIKECWWKCGCNKQCGNRVVQRGISRKLQVFMTSEGKGWGLRTLEDLPRGTFVCEYVGEVLTNAELFGRVSRSLSGEKHFHPVLLDADWGSGGVLKDEEALCLDATYYGNVARFINHRCFDSNLVEIPVEIESPDHHYYHLAFFTTRDVKAMEELTWDYGIDFDDLDYPIKAFQCQCGSQFCRNIKRLSSKYQGNDIMFIPHSSMS
ncbi:probable inactive histone-lysine N-methyltransferase SUVR2 isoform X1 [Ipomoea triloba]|uniref:probable inactive histone-lysine N-methyltransferase SUVR2 isoform X1 n=1 Tax=Ipomoea triloba TaxID=35885 RepID=UPI00125E65C9|nr:probable inactive histone-lysine N-methyltransferase SUVR2 isoform X1 [Ipomoea triloba]XP_031112414.1 probable inactive histone-lysine N-methyltransferase SUVR2 isoform X1 [Ipomoea triloba]